MSPLVRPVVRPYFMTGILGRGRAALEEGTP